MSLLLVLQQPHTMKGVQSCQSNYMISLLEYETNLLAYSTIVQITKDILFITRV